MRRTSWRALLTLVLAVVAMSAATIASAAGPPDGGKNRGHKSASWKERGHGPSVG